jgi:hypothetical protein
MNANRESGAINRDVIESITGNDFACPEGSAVAEVTGGLLPLLGSTDSHLREGALEILWHWGAAGRYSDAELRGIGERMVLNISLGLGESGTDTVFLRSFSALILEMVIQTDDVRSLGAGADREPFLSHDQVLEWFEASLAAFAGEEDGRGFVDGFGWAHAIAHKADLLGTLARGRHLDAPRLERVLAAITERLARPAEIILAFEEEYRLVRAAVHVLLRNEVQSEFLRAWIERLSRMPDGRGWGAALGLHECDQAANRARVNVRNFLRSLYFVLLWGMRGPGDAAEHDDPYHAYYDRPIHTRDALLADIEHALRGMNRPMYKDKETP